MLLEILKKHIGRILFAGVFAVLAGCATSEPVKPLAIYKPPVPVSVYGQSLDSPYTQTRYHVVGPQETLWRISKTYGVDMRTLLRANNLTDPKMISKGQKLIIPNAHAPKPVITLFPSRRWTHIVIHHTATEAGDAFTIDQLHHKRGFWNGLGYHFLIDNGTNGKTDGQIQVGPRWIKQMDGAHANAAGMNEHGIGIVIVGNFSETSVTEAELKSLVFLVKTLKDYYRIPGSNIIRHSDVPGKNTECPGNFFPWAEFKRRIA